MKFRRKFFVNLGPIFSISKISEEPMKTLITLSTVATCLVLGGCARDKVMHFGAGAGVSGVVKEYTGSTAKGCAAALAVGVAKEAYDSKYGGTVEAADAIATGAGCLTWELKF